MMFRRIKKMVSPSGRGSVLTISALLICSAVARLVASASGALAQDGSLPTEAVQSKQVQVPTEERNSLPTSEVKVTASDNVSNLIKSLQQREAQVSEREQKLEMRLHALSVADEEIEKRLVTLTETEEALRATLTLADEASEKDLLQLISVYESMKPKDAALLFEQMEPNFSSGFLGRMRPDIAAEIMANLTPQTAYSISVILAGRNANVPKS